jgi:hypothetical protein
VAAWTARATGRALDPEAVSLAVAASVRHLDTPYDKLLMSGVPRNQALLRIQPDIQARLDGWRHTSHVHWGRTKRPRHPQPDVVVQLADERVRRLVRLASRAPMCYK